MSISTPYSGDLQPVEELRTSQEFRLETCRHFKYKLIGSEYIPSLNATLSVLRVSDRIGFASRITFTLIPGDVSSSPVDMAINYQSSNEDHYCAFDFELDRNSRKGRYELVHRIVAPNLRKTGAGIGSSFYSYAEAYLREIDPDLSLIELSARQLSVLRFAERNGYMPSTPVDAAKIDFVNRMVAGNEPILREVEAPYVARSKDPYLYFVEAPEHEFNTNWNNILDIKMRKKINNGVAVSPGNTELDFLRQNFIDRLQPLL
jgi:hypothetical protein